MLATHAQPLDRYGIERLDDAMTGGRISDVIVSMQDLIGVRHRHKYSFVGSGEGMDNLQQIWPVIQDQIWSFSSLALVIFGLGWGAARLFYGERLEILKEKAGRPKEAPRDSSPKAFAYPTDGRHGRNLLSNTVREARVGDIFSLRAEIPKGSSLHVILKGLPPIYLEDTSAAWSYSVVGVANWVAGEYHQDMQAAEQHFNAEVGAAELRLYIHREGELVIEAYEGGPGGNSWRKAMRVRQAASANA